MEKGRRGWKDHSSSRATLFIDFLTKRSEPFTLFAPPGQLQWRIQGRLSGGPVPLFFDQNEARRAEKKFFGHCPPPPLSQGLDDRPDDRPDSSLCIPGSFTWSSIKRGTRKSHYASRRTILDSVHFNRHTV